MAWSKSTRIKVMIALDSVFLILELGAGYWVGSLALIADAFHMLNDIISLAVGLWAVMLAQKDTTDKYSYGWLRAEILGAFFNATFLIALCVTICLEAIQRFFDPPEIQSPELVLAVGCVGLASNLLGFWILGGHGHSHGSDDHSHGDEHDHGHAHEHAHPHDEIAAAEAGQAAQLKNTGEANQVDIFPEAAVARYTNQASSELARHISFGQSDDSRTDIRDGARPLERGNSGVSTRSRGGQRGRSGSARHNRIPSIDEIGIHPASVRQNLMHITSRTTQDIEEETESEGIPDGSSTDGNSEPSEDAPLINAHANGISPSKAPYGTSARHRSHSRRSRRDSGMHASHHHSKPKKAQKGGHGHNHGDMGMNAMILHVAGDALGNLGVIITAIIIWKATSQYRFYADPIVSLLITLIILKTAIPLVKATSKILLQATPDHIDINEIREDIQSLPGVISCHHIHVWQLSDTKIVCSMHIKVEFSFSENNGSKYMDLAKLARRCLHAYGIHSATIQAEFANGEDGEEMPMGFDGSTVDHDDPSCLLECVDDCVGQGCCSGSKAGSKTASRPQSIHSSHSATKHTSGQH